MHERQRKWIAYALLLVTAFAFRLYVARFLANDSPGDGKVYAQMARNLLEQHVYSHDEEPPYSPSIIRLPGYPLFLTAIYSVFGHYNNTAVRVVQALLDTLTCVLVALLAYYWEPDEQRKQAASIAALTLAAVCPFATIYVGTILTETWACLLAVALCLLATLAFKARTFKQSLWRWGATGLVGGLGVFFRPDSGLFVAAVGLTLVISELFRPEPRLESGSGSGSLARAWRQRLTRVVAMGAALSLAFVLLLIPWTVRNWRTFHLLQPLSPAHGEMPGEFVPRGYYAWVRSWVDDGRYVETVLWTLDDKPIDLDEMPESAFDSAAEKARVAALLNQYNNPPPPDEPEPTEEPPLRPTPAHEPAGKKTSSGKQQPTPSPSVPSASMSPSVEATKNDEDVSDEQTGDAEQTEEQDEPQTPEMTPAIDAAFGQVASERIARAPLRYYLWLPLKRAWALWVGPHADYYPFSGELFPLDDLDHTIHQHIWLPLFTGLVAIYSLLGIAGGWRLWRARDFAARRWLLLGVLLIFIRLAFFSTMENPEPRYTVEFFPFLAVLGGIALSRIRNVRQT
jgi:hypothetical protein